MVLKHDQIASHVLFLLLSKQTPEKITTLMQTMRKPYNDADSY